MRVLHVIARMNAGGTAQYLEKLILGLNSQEISTSIATGYVQSGEQEDISVEGLPVIRIQSMGRKISPHKDLTARRELIQVIQDFQPDIIHTHTFKAGLLVRSIKTSIPIVHTFHGHLLDDPEFTGFKKPIIIWLERSLARRTTVLVTVGERVATELLENGIGTSQQYVSIPPGVNPLLRIGKEEARKIFNLPNDALVGVWLARFAPVKNPLRMVEIAGRFPTVQFVMGGAGDLFDQVRKVAPNNLHVVGWVKANELLSAADFLISTSENEGMPVAFIEAQMMGLPVIATEVGSTSEVVLDGKTGRVVKSAELESALQNFLNDPDSATIFSKNALEAIERFSPNQMIRKHLELYESILNIDR